MASVNEISEYIWRRSRDFGVNPALALGIARYEGLNQNTIGSKTFGNPDKKGYSFGPYQLYSASSDPSNIAPGGMAYEFKQKFGEAPSRDNWQKQVDFSLETMSRRGTSPWYAVRDRGGEGKISELGAQYARQIGLSDNQPNVPPVQVVSADEKSLGQFGGLLGNRMGVLGQRLGMLGGADGGKVPFDSELPYSPPFQAPTQQMGAQFSGPAPIGGVGSVGGGASAALTSRPLSQPEAAPSLTPDQMRGFASLGTLGMSLMAAGAPKQTWTPSAPPPAVRGRWRDDLFAGLLG